VTHELVKVDARALLEHCAGLLAREGLPLDDARRAAELLLDADLRGLTSHGVAMLPSYLDGLRAGAISRRTSARLVADSGSLIILDAEHALGQLTSRQATALVAERAHGAGVAAVGVRHAHHFGAASTWSLRLAEAGLVGIVLSNTAPLMAAPGGARPVVGNNPLSIAVLDSDRRPLVADLAMSVGSVGKIKESHRAGAPIPPGWALDHAGKATQDPAAALNGTLMPMGGAKGFALAVLIEVLTGVLTGGPFGAEVVKFSVHPDRPNNCAHLFLAIAPAAVGLAQVTAQAVEKLVGQIQRDPTDGASAGTRAPGQWRTDLAREGLRSGVAVAPRVLEQLGWSGSTERQANRSVDSPADIG
jgi:LDH2 family malate/lactate/ureidoglycolate dehydrogenase